MLFSVWSFCCNPGLLYIKLYSPDCSTVKVSLPLLSFFEPISLYLFAAFLAFLLCPHLHLLVLQAFDGSELLQCIRRLIQVDQEWVPQSDSASLYVRPTFLGTEVSRAGRLIQFKSNFKSDGEKNILIVKSIFTLIRVNRYGSHSFNHFNPHLLVEKAFAENSRSTSLQRVAVRRVVYHCGEKLSPQ